MTCVRPVSPSGINTYRMCPRKFVYYVNRVPSLPNAFREATDFGTAVHEIIKTYYNIIPSDLTPGEVKLYVSKAMDMKWQDWMEGQRSRIEKQLLNFMAFEKKRLEWHINPKPIAVEREYRRGCLHGIVDALFQKGNKKVVVDWKTGRSTADLTDNIIVQLNVYLWLTGADEAYALFLEYGTFRRLTRSIDVSEIVEEMMSDRVYHPRVGEHCRFCEYQLRCMVDRGVLNPNNSFWLDV